MSCVQSNKDVHFSYLPLPHVFERIVQVPPSPLSLTVTHATWMD